MSGMLRRAMMLLAITTCAVALGAVPAVAAKGKFVTRTATASTCTPLGLTLPQFSPGNNSITRIPASLGKLPKRARILDVDATLRATTNDSEDLRVVLASPGGAMADLISFRPHNATTNDNLGTGPACGGTPTTLDDEAAVSIGVTPPQSPYAASYKPESPLSALDGGPAAGEFIFFAGDFDQGHDPVTIDALGLRVTYSFRVRKKPAKTTAAAAGKKFRTGVKDVCVPSAIALDNGNPPTDDLGYFLKSLPIPTGKLPKKATVTDVDLGVRATHTYPGDLNFFLSSPSGGTAAAWVGYDEGLDESTKSRAFGDGATDCSGALATFDDEAPISSTTADPPFGAATFQPTSPLSFLDGRRAGGIWTLWAEDQYFGDNGVLQAAGLHITYRYPVKPKKK